MTAGIAALSVLSFILDFGHRVGTAGTAGNEGRFCLLGAEQRVLQSKMFGRVE